MGFIIAGMGNEAGPHMVSNEERRDHSVYGTSEETNLNVDNAVEIRRSRRPRLAALAGALLLAATLVATFYEVCRAIDQSMACPSP